MTFCSSSNQNIESFETFFLDCVVSKKLKYLLMLRALTQNLLINSESQSNLFSQSFNSKVQKKFANIKNSLNRRKKTNDLITSAQLMDMSEPARTILLSEIAFVFRDEIDDYIQINFSNTTHVELLKNAVNKSLAKVTQKQGRPINEALDEFFIGLRDLYETATDKKAIPTAHYNNQPKTDFERLIYQGYQIIRPAQEYQAALKAYERAISRNS